MRTPNVRRYIITFIITTSIFGTAFYFSNSLNKKRIEQIRAIEEKISIDILSLETQFDLLEQLSCKQIKENPVLSEELQDLAERLQVAETQLGADDTRVIELKKSYSLLLIKDALLIGRVKEKCDIAPIVVYYFYSNTGNCEECTKQGYVLTKLSREYPAVRVYPFDYNLDLSALKTLIAIHGVKDTLPALIVGDSVTYGFKNSEELESIIPDLITATSTATSTDTMSGE